MKIVIRVDASIQIGTGHVMRCLTLAEALKQQGHQVSFICRAHFGHVIPRIQESGFSVHVLSRPEQLNTERGGGFSYSSWLGVTQTEDAQACLPIVTTIQPDWIIVDHYALDSVWHQVLRKQTQKIMVIDDLANRVHDCDLLLDQNYGSTPDKYHFLTPERCKIIVGSSYALLRDEFIQWRPKSLKRRVMPVFKNLLITLGGVDVDNVTGNVLNILQESTLPKNLNIIVVMGASAPHLRSVQEQAKMMPYCTLVKVNINNMAEIMTQADCAIGAAGSTTWERCCLGLPTIQIVIAENQKISAEKLAQDSVIKLLDKNFSNLIDLITSVPEWMQVVGSRASQVCDGLGVNKVLSQMGEVHK